MLQWFMRFPEFAEFIEFPFHLEKIPLFPILCWNVFINQWLNTSSKQEVCSHVLYSVTDPRVWGKNPLFGKIFVKNHIKMK